MKVLKGSIRRWGLTIDRISRGGINGGITPVSSLSKHSVGPPTLNTPPKTIHSSGMVELRIDGKMRKKECFFTKRNIGPNGVYYQAVTEWGFTIYALPSSMELIGCPTIWELPPIAPPPSCLICVIPPDPPDVPSNCCIWPRLG